MSRLTWTDPAPLKGEATAHEISEDIPGVAWAKLDGRPRPFHTADAALDEQPGCLLTGWLGTSPHETGKQVVA